MFKLINQINEIFRSFGVVLWELLTCEIPYRDVDSSAVIWGVGSKSLHLPVPSSCPDGFKLLMNQCWSAKPRNRPSFRHILMHIDIAASELIDIQQEHHFKMQEEWRNEIKHCLLRMKNDGRSNTFSSDDEAELIKKRKQELMHAQDIREHYERKLQRANNLYMEVASFYLRLEQREKELEKREKMLIGAKYHPKKRNVTPFIQAAHEKICSNKMASFTPEQIVTDGPSRNNSRNNSLNSSARSRIRRSRHRRSSERNKENKENTHSSNEQNKEATRSTSPHRKSLVNNETQTDSVFSENEIISPCSTLSPLSAKCETAIEMGDVDLNIRGITKTSTTSTFDSGCGDCQSCLSTPTTHKHYDRSPVTPISGKSSSIETDTEDSNKSKIKGRSVLPNQTTTVPSLSSIDENGVFCNGKQESNDYNVVIVRRGSITSSNSSQKKFSLTSDSNSKVKLPFQINSRHIFHHSTSNISIDSPDNSSSTEEEEGAVDSDDYRRPTNKRCNGLVQQLHQHRLSNQSTSTLSSDGNNSDEEEGNTSEYSSNHCDIVSSLSNPDLTKLQLNQSCHTNLDAKVNVKSEI